MSRLRRKPYIDYDDALQGFTNGRKELNDCLDESKYKFREKFREYKMKAKDEDPIAMDILAYFYKSGAGDVLPENYMRYISWEFVSAARGNMLAIEKLQFLIGYACELIVSCDDFEVIKYKNDINEYNVLYVLGKAVCKIIVRDFLKAYPVDLVELEDDYSPYQLKDFVTLRRYIDESVQPTIAYLKS